MSADVRPIKTRAELALADTFAAAKPTLPGGDGVAAWRDAAFARFAAAGLPHRRVEAWKYTDLRDLLRDVKPLASPPTADARARAASAGRLLGDTACRRLVFVDGAFVAELSDVAGLEDGLSIRSMAEALAAGDPLVLSRLGKAFAVRDSAVEMNTALMGDGAVIRVAAGNAVERPLHLIFAAVGEKASAMFMRSLVVVEKGARVTLLESHEGVGGVDHQVNAALELFVEDNGRVDHVKITAGGEALLVASLLATVGARATFNHLSLTTGGAVVRNQLFVRFSGEGAIADIRGASLLTGRQHVDTTLIADHEAGGCQTRDLFKAVLDGEARGVFQGKIIVRPNAQKTDAKMTAQALLLSERAEAIHKPELEIFADDVQCGHGATAGALNGDMKFYLMARGIPAKEAEALLIEAFVAAAIETVAHEGIRNALQHAAAAYLRARG